MTDPPPKDPIPPVVNQDRVAHAKSPAGTKPNRVTGDRPNDVSQLTVEEQMALYEKELKENDWGHQPC